MVQIIIGLVLGVLIALDAQRNLRTGSATTVFGAYSKQDRPTAFWVVFAIKVLLTAGLAALTAVLIVRNSP
jgi:hypothetical protein